MTYLMADLMYFMDLLAIYFQLNNNSTSTNQNKWPQTLTTASLALSKHMLHSNIFCSSLLSVSLLSVFLRDESDSLLVVAIMFCRIRKTIKKKKEEKQLNTKTHNSERRLVQVCTLIHKRIRS